MATQPVNPNTEDFVGRDDADAADVTVVTLQQSQATDEYQSDAPGPRVDETPEEEAARINAASGDPDGITAEQVASNRNLNANLTSAFGFGGGTAVYTTAGVGEQDDQGGSAGSQEGVFFGETAQTNATGNASSAQQPDSRILPQPNVLDRFASYTYQASVYLLTPEQFDVYQRQQKKTVSGYNLLFQSGGAPNYSGSPRGATAGTAAALTVPAGRNPFFPNDYYIDTITIENRLFGKATMAAHSVATLKFTVIEPANISLIDNIYQAVQDIAPRGADGAVNYAAAIYLMIIRFYGYDLQGRIQRVGPAGANGLTDPNAVVEKFIPFKIRHINWSVSSKLVTYEWDCAAIGQMVATSTRRGTIPADVELSGATVKSMLRGDAIYSVAQGAAASPGTSTTADSNQSDAETARLNRQAGVSAPAPAKASAAPNSKKNIRQGLMAAMNEEQQRLVKEKIYQYADIYELEFANGAESIADASVTKPGKKTNKSSPPMAAAASQNPSQSSPDKQSMDTTARNTGITAGMQIVQAIDLIIRNSKYITDQATVVIDETTGEFQPNPRANAKGIRWYNILTEVQQLQYDSKRNDFAYRIKYIIVPYQPVDFNSAYFPPPLFRGVHKKYSWWFTGENSQVLDYQATFNKLYNLTVSGNSLDSSLLAQTRKAYASSMRDIPFIQYQSRSTESSQGAQTRANELAANASEYLYNPSDNANAKIRIIGDPAWLQQGQVTGGVDAQRILFNPFEPDGTINFDTNDVLFEIAWQRPEDYDLQTGLADPYGRTKKTFGDREPRQSVIYRARTVTSEFRQGRFETLLDGTIYLYPIPQGTNKATTAAAPTVTNSTNAAGVTESEGRNTDSAPDQLLSESARMQNQGGPRAEPDAPYVDPGQSSGEFEEFDADSQPEQSEPAEPVTSNDDDDVELDDEAQEPQSAPPVISGGGVTTRRSEAANPAVQEVTVINNDIFDLESVIRSRERRGLSVAAEQAELEQLRRRLASAQARVSTSSGQIMAREA